MLLTITTTYEPATDLGYLLHKNPFRCQSRKLPFGDVNVFYPIATDTECTVAVLLDVDTIGLVRGRGRGKSASTLDQYVNDVTVHEFSECPVLLASGFAYAGRHGKPTRT